MNNILRRGRSLTARTTVARSTPSTPNRGNQRPVRSNSLPPNLDDAANNPSDIQDPPRVILDTALQTEFDNLSQSDQTDYMAYR
jgi:hypothetical protein